MNIAEILKDCPKGTKLYSPIFGEVKLLEIKLNEIFPIVVHDDDNSVRTFTEDGKYYVTYNNTECILFPSKENRDWSTFKVPKKECEFKPFDKVLVRDNDDGIWRASLFSHYRDCDDDFKYSTISGNYVYCIFYEGNEDLLGTSDPS